MPRPDSFASASSRRPLLAAAGLLSPRLPRLAAAITLGVLSLGSALALAGVSAWLITRAWQMPPVLDLSVAAVAVRMFAISRGVLHYCERLVTHDTALRASGAARVAVYQRLTRGGAAAAVRLHSGELVARVGADVDELANVLVRALVPMGVAAVLAVAATAVVAAISPAAGGVLAICLLVAGFVAPRLAGRAAATQEDIARQQHSQRDSAAMLALEHAPELRIAGLLPEVIAESQRRQRAWGAALDAAGKPAAVAEAMPTAAIGASVMGAVVAAIGMAHTVAPTTLAVLMLLPLSAFEGDDAAACRRRPVDPVTDRRAPPARAHRDRTPAPGRLRTPADRPGPADRRHPFRSRRRGPRFPRDAGPAAGGAAGRHRRQRLRKDDAADDAFRSAAAAAGTGGAGRRRVERVR